MVIEEINSDPRQLEFIFCPGGQHILWENTPANCLIVRSQPTSPAIESADTHRHDKELNIQILGNCKIRYQSAPCETESISVHKSCKDDRPMKFGLVLYFGWFILFRAYFQKSGLGIWGWVCIRFLPACSHAARMLPRQIMSLTPRHLWSVIRHLYMGYCCMSKFRFLFCFILLASVFSQSDAELIKTNQMLPPDCYAWFTEHGMNCPIKSEWDPPSWDNQWGYVNDTCCAGFPGTELHCQRNGTSDFPACLPDQPVGKGNAGLLIVNKAGNPQFVTVPCDNLTYESYNRVSSNITFPYCSRHKIQCNGEGEALLCHGGPVADDMCTCSEGYRPVGSECGLGHFTDLDECHCERLTCSDNEVAIRTPPIQTGSCSLMKGQTPPQFSCVKVPAVTDPSTHITSQGTTDPTAVAHPKLNTTDSSSIPPKDDIGIGYHILYGFLAFLVVVLLLIFIVVTMTRCRERRSCILLSWEGFSFSRLADRG